MDEKTLLVNRQEAERLNNFLNGADCKKYLNKWSNLGEIRFDDGCKARLEVYCRCGKGYKTFKVKLVTITKDGVRISHTDMSSIRNQIFTVSENHRVKIMLF